MFTGTDIVHEFSRLQISHVVWLPDSDLGQWEEDFETSKSIQLVRVCREGEAWPLAAGLLLGGAAPIVLMQTTGFFESGDALRNVVHDLKVPVFALVGARNWKDAASTDSARRFALPILQAWQIDYVLIESASQRHQLAEHYVHCRRQQIPGIILLAE